MTPTPDRGYIASVRGYRRLIDTSVRPPSEIDHERGRFDHAADHVTNVVSSGRFFAVSAVGFTVWLLFGVGVGFSIYWLQIGGTAMAGVAFLLVALVENQQRRSDQAVQRKLNAVTTALAELGETGTVSSPTVRELRAAVGLEKRESTAEVD